MDNVRPELELVVSGEGVTPSDVSLREFASMLAAISSLIDAIASESTIRPPKVAVVQVRGGSAAYKLQSAAEDDDPAFSAVVERTHALVRSRGRGASEPSRNALLRLFKACSGVGPLSLGGQLVHQGRTETLDTITMAAPLEPAGTSLSSGTVVHGRVVGVEAQYRGNRMVIRISPVTGPRLDMAASSRLAEYAGRLFNKTVRVRCRAAWDDDWKSSAWEVTEIEPWHETELATIMDDVADKLKSKGLQVDPGEILKTIRGD